MYICIYRKREREREKVIQVTFFPIIACDYQGGVAWGA